MSTDVAESSDINPARRGGRWPFWSALAVLLIGLAVTAALTLISAGLYHRNEKRLLALRAREVGSVLTTALPSIQTSLASAAALADATHGDPKTFNALVSRYVGLGGARPFVSVSLWRVNHDKEGPVTVAGAPPALHTAMQQAPAFFARAARSSGLTVIGLLHPPQVRLGYAFTGQRTGPFAAYGESALPANRYSPVPSNSAFSDLDYALFLGRRADHKDLLIASVKKLPLTGHQATARVPFGDTFFTIRVAARRPLGGSLPHDLPWAIAIAGTLLSLGAAALTTRLILRRRDAEVLAVRLEDLAETNQRLYAEQRGIAQTLQHALLPEDLPQVPGLQTSARYEAGVEGVEIGGDWYDLIALQERRLLLVVGDVSGRGLRAATTMAALRYAIHAYAAQGDSPDAILTKLSGLVSVQESGQLATVFCALVDVEARELTITSAGHLPPLLLSGQGSEFLQGEVGLPIGVDPTAEYSSTTVSAPHGATLLAFTDGLVERRGESIDVGLERLRAHAEPDHATLDELLARILRGLRDDHADDDTAIAGIRWMS